MLAQLVFVSQFHTVTTCTKPTLPIDRVLYEPERLTKIAKEAAKDSSVFSLNDRLGLVYDSIALSKAGLAQISSALTLINILGGNEKDCTLGRCIDDLQHLTLAIIDLVWAGIGENLSALVSTWWEHEQIVDRLRALQAVSDYFIHI